METDTEIPDIMTVTNLEVISGTKFTDFTIPATGLTLIHTGREQASTTLSMTLAGRMRPRRGRIMITAPDGRAYRDDRRRFQHIALAGVPEIDSLERLVTVRAVIREQAAWHQPWWKRRRHHPGWGTRHLEPPGASHPARHHGPPRRRPAHRGRHRPAA